MTTGREERKDAADADGIGLKSALQVAVGSGSAE
jgi:hypothetical protein